MTKERVKATEKIKVVDESDIYLAYESLVADKEAYIFYEFDDNKLIVGRYAFKNIDYYKNQCLVDYGETKKILVDKYGKPEDEEVIWYNKLYAGQEEKYGLAISLGHIMMFNKWDTDETVILQILKGENYTINLGVTYFSKSHYEHINRDKSSEYLKDFWRIRIIDKSYDTKFHID